MSFCVNSDHSIVLGSNDQVLPQTILDLLLSSHLELSDGRTVYVVQQIHQIIDSLENKMLQVRNFLLQPQSDILGHLSNFVKKTKTAIRVHNEVSMILIVKGIQLVIFHKNNVLHIG